MLSQIIGGSAVDRLREADIEAELERKIRVDFLEGCFPDLPRENLLAFLVENGDDVEKAVEAISAQRPPEEDLFAEFDDSVVELLQSIYPHLDIELILDAFQQCDGNLEKSTQHIDTLLALGEVSSPVSSDLLESLQAMFPTIDADFFRSILSNESDPSVIISQLRDAGFEPVDSTTAEPVDRALLPPLHVDVPLLAVRFPHIDRSVLEQVYRDCGQEFGAAQRVLREMYVDTPETTPAAPRANAWANGPPLCVVRNPPPSPRIDNVPSQRLPRVITPVERTVNPVQSPLPPSRSVGRELTAPLMDRACELAAERDEMRRRAAREFNGKNPQAARYYSERARELTEKLHRTVREANDKAVQATLAQYRHNVHGGELDLHGLTVSQALAVVEGALPIWRATHGRTTPTLTIITGAGRHSIDKQPRIRSAVMNKLELKGIVFDAHEGALVLRPM